MIINGVPFVWPTKLIWGFFFAEIGIFGFCALVYTQWIHTKHAKLTYTKVLLTMGLQRENASRGVMAIYTQIIFATVFERIFFQTELSALSAVGSLIIIASALYVAVRPCCASNSKFCLTFIFSS